MHAKVSPWRSLKTRITLLMLVVFALGIWSLSFVVNRALQTDMVRLLGDQQFSVVSTMANEVNNNLAARMQGLEFVAKLDAALVDNPAVLQASLERRPVLQQQFNGGIWVAGPDGTAIASVPLSANRVGVNYMDRDFIALALKEGKSTISRPVMGKQLNAPVFAITVPLRDAHGKVIGVIVGATNLGEPNFLDALRQGTYGKMGGYVLVAPQHQLIVTASVPTAEALAPLREQQQRLLWATLALTLLIGALTWLVLRRELAPVVETAQAMSDLADSTHVPQPLSSTQSDEIGLLVAGFNRILQTWAQRQAELQASEQQYRSLVENLSAGVVVHRPDTSISLSNPKAAELLGLTQDQMLGKTAPDPDWCFIRAIHLAPQVPLLSILVV